MELFAKPGVGGIIESNINGVDYILVQQRSKQDAKSEEGLLEIPAGKIREYENIFDCLRREILEETGLKVEEIIGEEYANIVEINGYKVLNYEPFSSSMNIAGNYPIMVQVFICYVSGEALSNSEEAKNIRWISLTELNNLLEKSIESFYPMHISTLKKYLRYKKVK